MYMPHCLCLRDDMKKVELPDRCVITSTCLLHHAFPTRHAGGLCLGDGRRGGTFNVYCAGSSGPVVLAIHGAGYTGCTWSLVAANLKSK